MSFKKIVFAFETPTSQIDSRKIIPISELSAMKFRNALSDAFEYLRTYEGILGLRPELDFRPSKFGGAELDDFLEHLCGRPEVLSDTRVIISDTDIEVCQIDGNGKALFIVSSSDHPSYDVDAADHTKFKVKMRPNWMGKFIFDYMVELYIANSIPAVRRFVDDQKHGGLVRLYELKDQFIKQQLSLGNVPDVFQSGNSPAQYACFHNSTRTNRELFSINQTRLAVDLWDQFVLQELSNYLTSYDTLKVDLKGWKRVHGQLSQSRLAKRFTELGKGAYVILRQRRSSQFRTPKSTAENVHTVIEGWSRRSNLNRGFAIISTGEIQTDPRGNMIHDLIDSEYLQVYRMWVK